MKRLLFLLFMGAACCSLAQEDIFRFRKNQSLTYDEAIAVYRRLDEYHAAAQLQSAGLTDVGRTLQVFVISSDGDFDPVSIRKKGKAVVLINNGIHPGEPDGIDASAWLATELLSGKYDSLLARVVVCIVPVYNIDGALNRGCCSRANQEGPEAYGFRGNARNLDLNRDFIKADAANTKAFTGLFRKWDPDVFADTHVSDGADYQYTMTLIATQHDKLGPAAGTYLTKTMLPALYGMMKAQNEEMCPYVNTHDETPDSGIDGFLETPRFATGYAALFHTFGFVLETHMLKPFPARVQATHDLLMDLVQYTASHAGEIMSVRKTAMAAAAAQTWFPLQWSADTSRFEMIPFKGYEAMHKTSDVTGMQRLYYDRQKPYRKDIRFYDHYAVTDSVKAPAYYVVPMAWNEVIQRLQWNRVTMQVLPKDTDIAVSAYYITGMQTGNRPYEGHYLHSRTTVREERQTIRFHSGDCLIPVSQPAARYIVETLEPRGGDSFFSWGFFDAVLQQKEYFSDYVFEDKAAALLSEDKALKKSFEEKRSADSAFAADPGAMLHYIYEHSPYFEKTYNRYPVYRILK